MDPFTVPSEDKVVLCFVIVSPTDELRPTVEAMQLRGISRAFDIGIPMSSMLEQMALPERSIFSYLLNGEFFQFTQQHLDFTPDKPRKFYIKVTTGTGPAAPSASGPAAPSASDGEKLTAMLRKLNRIEKGISISLWSTFWGDISSTATTETTEHFRKILVAYYGDTTDRMNVAVAEKPLRCMVTDLRLPGKWITAGHLLARKDKNKALIFGITDIDDPRNGLLWNRTIEEAFSSFQIVFSWSEDLNSFLIHILDKELSTQKISEMKLRKPLNRSLDSFMDADTKQKFENMTFADIEGKPMVFNNLNRPFKRVMCLHAKIGIHKAREEEKLPPDLDLEKYNFDYWTEASNTKILHTFLADSQAWITGKMSSDDVDLDFEGLSVGPDSPEDN